jgi:uncharacterized protein (TIGR02246 family)
VRRTLKIAAVTLITAGCTTPATDGAGADAPDLEALRASLREAAEAYQAAASAKDADAVVAMYDADALMVPPSGEMVRGLDGVRDYRFGFIETPGVSLSFDLQRVEVSASGDLGWSLSVGYITIAREDGSTARDVVRDVHTWRRQPDGSWKVVLDVWNSGVVPGG